MKGILNWNMRAWALARAQKLSRSHTKRIVVALGQGKRETIASVNSRNARAHHRTS